VLLVKNVATLPRLKLKLALSRMLLLGEVIPLPGPMLVGNGAGAVGLVGDLGPYCSRMRSIALRRLRQEDMYSPPVRLAQTREKTEALSARSRMKSGKALKLSSFVSAAGDISGKPGLLITWTL
jgi:hypothetical protein